MARSRQPAIFGKAIGSAKKATQQDLDAYVEAHGGTLDQAKKAAAKAGYQVE